MLYILKHKRFGVFLFFKQSETGFGQCALSFCVKVAGRKVLSAFARDSKEINAVNKNF